jgi:ribonuclease E
LANHKKQMLINYVPGEECRIAIVTNGRLEEFYQERASSESHVGNIYKGRVVNIESSIQAAFVDFGLGQNGFLHVTDLHPMYFPGNSHEEKAQLEQVGSKTPHRERPPIQKALRKGQEVLVQVLKEGIGTKGPTLTTYLSIPGRFLVMMPHMQHMGVSRKVEDEDTRKEMRKILEELNPPQDFGFIVRTAGFGQTKTDLKRDLSYLQRLWRTIEKRRKQSKGPGELYAESDLIIRTIRDVFSSDLERIVVDDLTAAQRARDFLAIANPRAKSRVVYYDDPVPLFHRFQIEQQIENINSHTVPLPSGGSLVIEQTEALVAIDVNSGKSKEAQDAETNAYNTNLEAVDEICRQLRLRDLGGVVVNDLIDMRSRKHRRQIEQRFRNNLKNDRARTRTGSISQFGIVEMTRQRMRPSLKTSIYMDCPSCGAPSHVKTPESVVLDVMRRLALVMHRDEVARIELTISPDVAFHLLNRKRAMLVSLEQRFGKSAVVRVGGHAMDHVKIEAYDKLGNDLGTDADFMENRITAETETTYRDLDDPALELESDADEDLTVDAPARAVESEKTEAESALEAAKEGEADEAEGQSGRRRRRRRGGRRRKKAAPKEEAAEPEQPAAEQAEEPEPAEAPAAAEASETDQQSNAASSDGQAQGEGKSRRRGGRRRGGRRRRKGGRGQGEETGSAEATASADQTPEANPAEGQGDPGPDASETEAVTASTEAVESVESGGASSAGEAGQLELPESAQETADGGPVEAEPAAEAIERASDEEAVDNEPTGEAASASGQAQAGDQDEAEAAATKAADSAAAKQGPRQRKKSATRSQLKKGAKRSKKTSQRSKSAGSDPGQGDQPAEADGESSEQGGTSAKEHEPEAQAAGDSEAKGPAKGGRSGGQRSGRQKKTTKQPRSQGGGHEAASSDSASSSGGSGYSNKLLDTPTQEPGQ